MLDPERSAERRPSPSSARSSGGGSAKRRAAGVQPSRFTGPYVKVGPYEDDGDSYEVRLERVPGGLRLGEWAAGTLRRRAPVLRAADLAPMLADALSRDVLPEADVEAMAEALGAEAGEERTKEFGASPGRTGDMQEELRVEPRGEGMVRIARWVLRPASGWELQDAPAMLPAKRYAQALRDAARAGLLTG